MKKLTFLSLIFICQHTFAQKVSVKDDLITVDGNPYAKIEKQSTSGRRQFKIKNTNDKSLIIVSVKDNDPNDMYAQFVFLDSIGQKCEIPIESLTGEKFYAKVIVKNGLIKNGEIDTEAAKTFVLVNGTPFSDRKTIIIKH